MKTRIGILGAGDVSGIYLKNLSQLFPNIEVRAIANRTLSRAQEKGREFPGVSAMSVEELLDLKDIDIVVNLTVPSQHADLGFAVLGAGKSLYQEKPLTATLEDGERLLSLAASKGLRVGSAPDTFLGAGLQTCRKLIDDGWIGRPIGGSAFVLFGGHEHWHPNPDYFYQVGGGPLFDLGPYYLTALVSLLGPVKELVGTAKTTHPTRVIPIGPRRGEVLSVEVPTHVSGILEFARGCSVSITTSYDVSGGSSHIPIEIYGTEGTLQIPDPNLFGGVIRFRRRRDDSWSEVPQLFGYSENSRGLGVADMAAAMALGVAHRANGEMAFHVLEVMHGIYRSAESGQVYTVKNLCKRPDPLSEKAARDAEIL